MPKVETSKSSLASRAFWLLIAKTLSYVISFVLPILLVRRLNQTEFGFYKQAFLIVNTAVTLLPMGFMMSTYYFLPREPRERHGTVVANVLLFYYVLGSLVFAITLLWPNLLVTIVGRQGANSIEEFAPLIGLTVLFWIGSSFLEVISVANQEAHLTTVFIINAQLTKTIFLVIAASCFGSVRALLWAATLQGILQAIVLQFYLRSRFGTYLHSFDFRMLLRQLSYALPLGFAGLLFYLMIDMHNYFVSNQFGAATFAAYSLGSFAMPLVTIIGTSVSAVMIPRISELQIEGKTREMILTTARAMRKLAIMYFPIYAFMFVMGHEIIEFLFTELYAETWPVFIVNITLIPFLTLIADPIMRAHKEHRFYMLRIRLILVPALFVTLWCSIKYLTPVSVISIAVGFTLLDRFIETLKSWRIIGVTWSDIRLLRDLGKITLAAFAAAIITALTRTTLSQLKPFFILTVCGFVFAVIYLLCFWMLKTIAPEEIEFIRHYLVRIQYMLGRTVAQPSLEK